MGQQCRKYPFPLIDAKPELTDFLDKHRQTTLYEMVETQSRPLDEAIRWSLGVYADRCLAATAGCQSRPRRAFRHPPQRDTSAELTTGDGT